MIVGFINFDCDRMGRRAKLGAMSKQMWIDFSEKEGNMRGGRGF